MSSKKKIFKKKHTMSKTLVLIISIDDENREYELKFFICVHVYGLLHYQLHEYGVSSFFFILYENYFKTKFKFFLFLLIFCTRCKVMLKTARVHIF